MSSGADPPVAVVVLNYNGADLTEACIASVLPDLRPNDRLLVVDNGSTAADRARLQEALGRRPDPRVRLLALPTNVGFSGGMNRGYAETREAIVVLLNNDVVLERGWLEGLLRPLRDPKLAASFANLDEGGPAARTGVNVFGQTWSERGGARVGPFRVFGGACVALRRAAVERCGGLFPDFFAYYEDVDLSWRLVAGGWTIGLAEGARGRHVGEATMKRDPNGPLALRLAALRVRNKHLTFWRHARRAEGWALAPWLWGLDLARIAALVVRGKRTIARARVQGLREYLALRRSMGRTRLGARGFVSVDFRPNRL